MSPIPLSISEVLTALRPTYKALNVGVCAVGGSSGWEATVTVLRFSHRSPTELEAANLDLLNQWQLPHSDNFRILYRVIPVQEADLFINEVAQTGQLVIGDVLLRGLGFGALKKNQGYISEHASYFAGEEAAFPAFALHSGNHPVALNKQELRRLVGTMGMTDVYTAVNALLQTKLGPTTHYDLLVVAPFYARMENVRWDPSNSIRLDLVRHRSMSGLDVQILETTRNQFGESQRVKRRTKGDHLIEREESTDFVREDCIAPVSPLEVLSLREWVTVTLIHPTLGVVLSRDRPLLEFLPASERNPLIATLGLFCSRQQFRALLTQPKFEHKDPSQGFERAISWLLACAGFSVVWLGKQHEKLYEMQRKAELGSVDLIACHFERRILLLAGCTTGVPESREIDELQNMKSELKRRALGPTLYSLVTALFTSAQAIPASRDLAHKANVRIFDNSDLDRLVWQIEADGPERFITSLCTPPLNSGLPLFEADTQ